MIAELRQDCGRDRTDATGSTDSVSLTDATVHAKHCTGTTGTVTSPSAADCTGFDSNLTGTVGSNGTFTITGSATDELATGVYQVSVPRRETIRENGHEIPPSMGVATGINFQPTGGAKAAITGDFVMRASEVNAVIRTLQQSGIEVTALHSHMLDEEPRLFFMHFWANDDAVKLAQGLRRALDQMAVKRTAAR